MVKIGNSHEKKTVCVLTDMDQPLGFAVGNAVEVLEAIDTLKGKGPEDLTKLVLKLGSLMVSLGLNISLEEALKKVTDNLYNGYAYQKFLQWVKYQQGDINSISVASNVEKVLSSRSGYIKKIDALKIGKLARELGAGRLTKDDVIDLSVGIVLNVKVGDYVDKNDVLAKVYYNEKQINVDELISCFEFSFEKAIKNKLIIEVIS